ncbi:MAG: hypothetical protein Q4B68_09175 [Bacteroidales bacterium]|nr:hypothetical protein [Bacteroidales bacterium]
MSKVVKFNIKVLVDGKEQIVQTSVKAKELENVALWGCGRGVVKAGNNCGVNWGDAIILRLVRLCIK